jgi:hypothetical protein
MKQGRFDAAIIYRDANQFTGLEDCQVRSEEKLYFHIDTALTMTHKNNPKVKELYYFGSIAA